MLDLRSSIAGTEGDHMPLLHASMKSLGRAEALTALVVFMAVTVGLSQEATSGVQSKGWTPIQLKYAKYIALTMLRRSR